MSGRGALHTSFSMTSAEQKLPTVIELDGHGISTKDELAVTTHCIHEGKSAQSSGREQRNHSLLGTSPGCDDSVRRERNKTCDKRDQKVPEISRQVHINVGLPFDSSIVRCKDAQLSRNGPNAGCSPSARRAVLALGAVMLTVLVIALPISESMEVFHFPVVESHLGIPLMTYVLFQENRRSELLNIPPAPHPKVFYENTLVGVNNSMEEEGNTEHLGWSHDRVRDEVYALQRTVKNEIMREYKHHFSIKKDIEEDRAGLKDDVGRALTAGSDLKDEVGELGENMAAGMKALKFSESELRSRMKLFKAHYDRDLARIHAILTNETLSFEQDGREELEKMYKKELVKMQGETDRILKEDRETMDKNDANNMAEIARIHQSLSKDVGNLTSFQNVLSSDLQNAQYQHQTHTSNITMTQDSIAQSVVRLQSAAQEIRDHQKELQDTASQNLDALDHADSQLKAATFKLDMLEKKLVANQESLDDDLTSVRESGTEVGDQIKEQMEVMQKVKEEVDKFASENPEFRKQIEADHEEFRGTIANLKMEIDKVDAVKKQIADLQTSLESKANDMSSKLDDMSGKQEIEGTTLNQQGSDIESIMTRIEGLSKQAEDFSKSATDDHDEVSKTIEDMQTKLSGLMSLKDDLATVQTKADDQLGKLETKLGTMHTEHNATSLEISKTLVELRASLDTQINAEKAHYTGADDNLNSMQKDIDDLDNYKVKAAKMEQDLVKQLTDTTQSLGILDAKFSGKDVDLNSQIEEMRSAIAKVPTREDFNKSIAAAMDKADNTQKTLDDLGVQVRQVRDDQDRDSNALAGISTDVRQQNDHIDEQWKTVRGTLTGEGDLFAKVASKLNDGDLGKDVDDVFGRSPSS